MGIETWFREKCGLMTRTKPHYISILGRKRSSIRSPPKLFPRTEGKCGRRFGALICVVTMFCSVSYGVLTVLSSEIGTANLMTQLVSLGVAASVAVAGGACLSEYINNQSQEVPSIYTCCYQNSSEILAFFTGWTWIISQAAVISALCKLLTVHVNDWSGNTLRGLLDRVFPNYAIDIPSILFVLVFILFNLTGLGETVFWYLLFIPVACVMVAVIAVIWCVFRKVDFAAADLFNWDNIEGINKILTSSTLGILFFSGPQSILRIPLVNVRKNTAAVLCPLNGITIIIAFVFIMLTSLSNKFTTDASSNELINLAINVLYTLCVCSLAIESFFPLHYVIEDMASDGLLFRNLSKKWKPFCFPVASCAVHVLSFLSIGSMSLLMALFDVLNLAAVFPLLVHTVVPFLVLIQRYRQNSEWQYEPMFHTAAKCLTTDHSRKKSLELQYTNVGGFDIAEEREISTTCIDEIGTTTSSDSETDIDSLVQQYKDQSHISKTKDLDDPSRYEHDPEPTPSTFFRAKFGIIVLLGISLIVSITLNFAEESDHLTVLVIVFMCVMFSTIIQGLLLCLPQNAKQNTSKLCCIKMPTLPWIPGMASLISSTLLVHAVIQAWKVCVGCYIFGFLLYFLYGIHSSTAANSFHNMRTTHIALRPLPSYGNNCIPQIVPSQRKSAKIRKQRKINTL